MADLNIPVIDYPGFVSVASLPVADAISDANITVLFGSVDALTVGNLGQSTLDKATPKNAGPGGLPADQHAQRELKWLCHYHDATTLGELTLEIPCADYSLITGNTTNMNLAAGAGQTFKTQFDAVVKAALTGNAVVLDSVELIGMPI